MDFRAAGDATYQCSGKAYGQVFRVKDGALTTDLGNVYMEHGWYDKARRFYEQALAGREKSLEVGHPDTLSTVNSMASVFNRQGQYDRH